MIYLVDKIISGIANVLDQNYPDVDIYAQEVKQNMKEPCFFIQSMEVGTRKRLANRYDQTRPFEIVYFPKKRNTQEKSIRFSVNFLFCWNLFNFQMARLLAARWNQRSKTIWDISLSTMIFRCGSRWTKGRTWKK